LQTWSCSLVVVWGRIALRQRTQKAVLRVCRELRCSGEAILKCVISAALLSACTVGPDFRSPPPPAITSLTPMPLSNSAAQGPRQVYVPGLDIPRRWWELFHCKALNSLVTRGIERSPDLEAARATLRAADANTQAARGAYFPQVTANAGPSWQRPSATQPQLPGLGTSPYTISTAQLSISFVPDVFGLNSRHVESLAAQAEAQYFEVEAAHLTLTSKLALAAIEEASIREESKFGELNITVAADVLALLRRQMNVNEATRIDVASQEVTLSQFEQTLQSLRKRLAGNRDLMAALTGGFAGEGIPEKFEFDCLRLPTELPLSLPASIVRQRPDVRAAEANMHAATAEVGVAIANRFPQFNLTANAGASAIAQVAGAANPFLFWTIAGSAAQTLCDGMSLQQRQRAAEAGLDRSAALYRSTVFAAFQNVADVLQTIDADRKLFAAADSGAKAARDNLQLTRRLLAQRLASVLQVLSAQEMHARARSAHAQAKAALRADAVLLFQALGGGWSRSSDDRNVTSRTTPGDRASLD
jgi:NodT family efflux transporter outer membrane factor (OMF) lipoprotein